MSGGDDLLVCPSELREEAWAGSRQEPRGHQAGLPLAQRPRRPGEEAAGPGEGLRKRHPLGELGSGENRKVEGTFIAENPGNFAVDGGVRKASQST